MRGSGHQEKRDISGDIRETGSMRNWLFGIRTRIAGKKDCRPWNGDGKGRRNHGSRLSELLRVQQQLETLVLPISDQTQGEHDQTPE